MIIDTVIEASRLAVSIPEEVSAPGPHMSWMNDADSAHIGNIKLGPIDGYNIRCEMGVITRAKDQGGKG